jgi:RNA polymerase subunit RPABC4/transcription elongation factor Spt4
VSERWICNRCYTSAEEGATVCPNCGLARGADAPDPSDATEAPEPESLLAPAAAAPTEEPELEPAAPYQTLAADPERWVCLRCFTSNDGTAAICANCGLERGADPSAEPGQAGEAWVPPAAPVEGGASRFPWRWVAFGVFVVIALGASYVFAARRDESGEVTGAGDLSVFDIQVGDCFDVDADATEVESVRAIPCGEPHTYEMFWTGTYPGDEQPTEDEYFSWLEGECIPAFEAYVGIAFADSIYYIGSLSPTKESWGDGDREFSCYLHNLEETPVTGSAEGSAQ